MDAHWCQLQLKAIWGGRCTNTLRPHPLTPSPPGEGELNLLLPSPRGRGAGGEGETLQPSGFHVNSKIAVKLSPFPLLPFPLPHSPHSPLFRRYGQTNCKYTAFA